MERKITNTHLFGKRELVINNVLVLEIDQLGLLAKMDFYNIEDMIYDLSPLSASILSTQQVRFRQAFT